MSDKAWKQAERRAAAIFDTKRQRCSGSGGREDETRSDSKHPKLFLETKLHAYHAARTLFDATKELAKKEGKLPVLMLATKNRPGFLVCVHSDDLVEFADIVGTQELRRLLAEETQGE